MNVEFIAKIRKSGRQYIITIPKEIVEYYRIRIKKAYKFNIEILTIDEKLYYGLFGNHKRKKSVKKVKMAENGSSKSL